MKKDQCNVFPFMELGGGRSFRVFLSSSEEERSNNDGGEIEHGLRGFPQRLAGRSGELFGLLKAAPAADHADDFDG